MTPALPPLPVFEDLVQAQGRLAGAVRETPVLSHPELDRRAGAQLLIKAESLQVTGSFKIRGATNRLSRIPPEGRAAGVVAFSSGNHAQGVARAARLLSMPALIVMPGDAPQVKIDGVLADGGEVHLFDRSRETVRRLQDASPVSGVRSWYRVMMIRTSLPVRERSVSNLPARPQCLAARSTICSAARAAVAW